jgi:putative FmdB family regulatory protein
MPIYEYGCEAGHRFEVKQKISDAPLAACRVCDLPVTKLVSAPAIMFKGAGWYVTDYSDKMKPPATEDKSGKPSEPASPSTPAGSASTSSTSPGTGSAPASPTPSGS